MFHIGGPKVLPVATCHQAGDQVPTSNCHARRLFVLSRSYSHGLPCTQGLFKCQNTCALPGNRTRVARMGILHDTTTPAVLTAIWSVNLPGRCIERQHTLPSCTKFQDQTDLPIGVVSPILYCLFQFIFICINVCLHYYLLFIYVFVDFNRFRQYRVKRK